MYKYSTCNINSQDNIKIIHLGLTVRSFFAKVPRRASGQCLGSLSPLIYYSFFMEDLVVVVG